MSDLTDYRFMMRKIYLSRHLNVVRSKKERKQWSLSDTKDLAVDPACQVQSHSQPANLEMLKPSSALMGAGLGQDVALLTDGRFSGGSHGFLIGIPTQVYSPSNV
jgi:hypothetical protein